MVQRALQALDVPDVAPNTRYDILQRSSKVSGAAYKLTQDKAYHHGTMLLRSDLSTLRACFAVPGAAAADWDSRSVPSVPASVANVSPEISPEAFTQSLLRQFASEHDVNRNEEIVYIEEEDIRNMRDVQKIKDELAVCNALDGPMKTTDSPLQQWEHAVGSTPAFSRRWFDDKHRIHVRKGRIVDVDGPDALSRRASVLGRRWDELYAEAFL